MIKLVSISKAAKHFGVTVATIRRWEKSGKLKASSRTAGNQRRYDLSSFCNKSVKGKVLPERRVTYAYARVSSNDQKEDLKRQIKMLELYCSSKGWSHEIISDLGSGMNYNKRGLKKLLEAIINGKIDRLVLTHKDRLLRFGAELIFSLCEVKQIEVILINQNIESSFEEELAQDVLEIITVFSAKLYGSRSRKNKKLINNLKEVVKITNE